MMDVMMAQGNHLRSSAIQSSPDISTLRKARRFRINYEHRHYPGEIKKSLCAEDVIFSRYKYVSLINQRERSRIFKPKKKRKQSVLLSGSIPRISLVPMCQNSQGDVDNDYGIKESENVFNSENAQLPFQIERRAVSIDFNVNLLPPLSSRQNLISFNNDGVDDQDESEWKRDDDNKSLYDSDDNENGEIGEGSTKELTSEGHNDSESDDSPEDVPCKSQDVSKDRPLTSPDFDTDLDSDDNGSGDDDVHNTTKRRRHKNKQLETYHRSCSKCDVIPNKSFTRQCGKATMDMRNRLLTNRDVKPMAIVLVNERRTAFLDLSMNPLGPVGTNCLAQMLTRNNSIVELNLSNTCPKTAGLEALALSLFYNKTLRRLYLENNDLKSSDGEVLAKLIKNAMSLQELYLGYNGLGFGGIKEIAKALNVSSGNLNVLSLRYNSIRTDTAVHLAKTIARNKTLNRLDVSWNGFGEAGCKAIAEALGKNNTLKYLDLSCNRLGLKTINSLIQGITKNKGLLSLSVSFNPLTTEGVKAVLSALLSQTRGALTELDVRGIPVDEEFLILKQRLEQARSIRLLHEMVVSLGTSDMSRSTTGTFLDNYEPVMAMFEFMKKDNLRVIDLFQFFDIRKRDKLGKKDFSVGFKTLSIPFTKHHIDVIVKTLDTDKDGFVSLDEMVKGYTKNDKAVKARRIKASMKKTTDQGLENLWTYLKTLITKRKEDNDKKNAINSQARRNNFLPGSDANAKLTPFPVPEETSKYYGQSGEDGNVKTIDGKLHPTLTEKVPPPAAKESVVLPMIGPKRVEAKTTKLSQKHRSR